MNHAQRLIEIAQRLDELSGDGESELQSLSAELGEIADAWTDPNQIAPGLRTYQTPRWVYEMQKIMEQAMQERYYSMGNSLSGNRMEMLREITVAEQSNPTYTFTRP